MQGSVRGYLLFATTIFLSAFLLFVVQPIAGKLLLPWFGGSSSVWATSMLFFTSVLFLGYCYTYFLTRLPLAKQVRIHRIAIGIGGVAALVSLFIWQGLFPSLDWTLSSALPPALKTLAALLFGIGIPYFLLATTGPLIQFWYGISSAKEPYKLYAISNAGSLLALASYPFVVEPFALLAEQETIWSLLFVVFAALLLVIMRDIRGVVPEPAVSESIEQPRMLLWVLYAALPAFMLVATTTEITQTIAPLPLLWIIPLSLYLLSFIFAFAGYRGGMFVPILLLASAYGAWEYVDTIAPGIEWRILFDCAVLFFLAWHAHAHVYRLRPSVAQSPKFYMLVSFGGMLGTLLASVVPPLVFPDYYEFAIGLALSAAVAFHISPAPWLFRSSDVRLYAIRVALTSLVVTLIAYALYANITERRDAGYTHISRNFYGTVKVYVDQGYRSLMHGMTLHGVQVTDPELEFIPFAYYSPESGAGRAIMYSRLRNPDDSLSIGILGLGAGMTAAYCTPKDRFVYYEIDPRVEGIAREYFTYLSRCPQVEIRLGDGRIRMDQEYREGTKGNYDVVLADAFADDTIPVHLITKEAIQRYVSHLKDEQGIVGMHISNRYLDMLPVLMAIAQEEGLSLLDVYTNSEVSGQMTNSHWVLLSPSPETFTAEIFKDAATPLPEKRVRAWTDSYSNLLSVLDIR
ncbi:fused MFS/spermidine synthase [bacterium]|nr:fused MFS/spermidine synthase [bacterium]